MPVCLLLTKFYAEQHTNLFTPTIITLVPHAHTDNQQESSEPVNHGDLLNKEVWAWRKGGYPLELMKRANDCRTDEKMLIHHHMFTRHHQLQ